MTRTRMPPSPWSTTRPMGARRVRTNPCARLPAHEPRMLTAGKPRVTPNRCPLSTLRARPRLDPLEGALPAGVERLARLVEVDDDGRVIGGGRRSLARLAVDLR